MHRLYFLLLLLFLFIKASAIMWAILHAGIGLGPDEAQYWTWSHWLDWGYYSKPPGIAWEIWLGTHLFGDNELGVRFPAIVIGCIIPLLVYWIAQCCRLAPLACFWAAVLMAFSPMGILASLLAITDGGMVLFWAASCAYLAKNIQNEKTPNYLILGLLIMFGALFKWPIYCLWIFVGASWLMYPTLRSRHIWIGIIVSLLALLPSVYWNATHEWATFRHVLATIGGGHPPAKANVWFGGNVLEFIGAQAGLVSPILFILMVIAVWKLIKQWKTVATGIQFCGFVSLAIVGVGAFASLFMKLQGNWTISAYPTAFVVLAWYACEVVPKSKKWLIIGTLFSVVLGSLIFSLSTIQSSQTEQALTLPYRMNPFRHNVGWDKLDQALVSFGYDPKHDFLFGDKYQTASILSFYGSEQKRAYFLNLQGVRKNQFSYWPSMGQEQLGKRGFFVVVENAPHLAKVDSDSYVKQLEGYFKKVNYLGTVPLFFVDGKIVKGALIFECIDYNGREPDESGLY